ncbi:MAG TPA: SIMPL domain-containing protein [Bacteroidales bacterium]|nr:SIMPL domain-containing protein [Bacteroidales bacterium]
MKDKSLISTVIIAFAIIVTGYLLGTNYKNRSQKPHTAEVTGLAEKNFTSDLIVWNGSFSKFNKDMKLASNELKKDVEKVRAFLAERNIPENEILFSAVQINREYETTYDEDGNRKSEFVGYQLTQNVKIESKNIKLVEKVSRDVSALIDEGVEFYSDAPMFYYTKLSDLKLQLIEEATKDGRARADKIAENSGGSIKRLMQGNMGVFQITARNSNEDYSWGGAFNTSSLEKTASITVHLVFEVR